VKNKKVESVYKFSATITCKTFIAENIYTKIATFFILCKVAEFIVFHLIVTVE